MPGSWEIREANQVLCAILHTDVTTVAWSFGLRNLIIPGREDLRRFNPFLLLSGMPFDHARNQSVKTALEVGAEWLFCYDSDVIPPRDAILRLMSRKKPFISGVYARRSPPHGFPVMIRGSQWVTQYRPGELLEVDLVGAGCLLIHRSVLESLPPQRPGHHWFDWRVHFQGLLPPSECLSEDFTLCRHAIRHGFQVYVDTSVVCRHVGFFETTPGQASPLNCTPVT